MDNRFLPTGEAREPLEEAEQLQVDVNSIATSIENSQRSDTNNTMSRKKLRFETGSSLNSSQSSSQFRKSFSPPPKGLSHRDKLLWLQEHRRPGLYVQCDDCDRWRYLPNVEDRSQLPAMWYCYMNPDKNIATCLYPEDKLRVHEQEDLIFNEYSAGSVVWAHLPDYPWWPAMVDDCVDTEQFYFLDGFSDIPVQYNVVFFDSRGPSRSWIKVKNLHPYVKTKERLGKASLNTPFRSRIRKAMEMADEAIQLPLQERLRKYSFLTTFKGKIEAPKKVSRRELMKHKKVLEKRFNLRLSIESSNDTDENIANEAFDVDEKATTHKDNGYLSSQSDDFEF